MNIQKQGTKYLNNLFYLVPFILGIITTLIYLPTVNFGFLFDDVPNIMKFYEIRFASFKDLFFSRSRWLSAWLNTMHYKIGQFEPFSYRLFNIIMHSVSGILVFFIFLIALGMRSPSCWFHRNRFYIATFTCIFFLLHPVQTQTISYVIQGQLEGLAACFTFLIILLFLLVIRSKTALAYYGLLTVLTITGIFAVGTKDIIIVCPLLVLLIDWFFIAHGSGRDILKKRAFIHLLLMVIIWGGFFFLLLTGKTLGIKTAVTSNVGNQLTQGRFDVITPFAFFISQFKVIVHYLWIFIWPFKISVDYDENLVKGFFALDCFLPFLFLCALAGYSFYRFYKKHDDLITFGIWWFFIVIAPRSSWIPATELIADYKTYLASAGIFFLLASGILSLITTKKKSYGIYAISLCLIFILGLGTYFRNRVWASAEALWGDALKKAPLRARVYNNYANALLRQQKAQEAIPYYKKALEIDKHYPDAWVNLGTAYESIGNLDEAFKAIAHSLELQKSPENYLAFGNLCMKLKRYQDALTYFQGAAKKYFAQKKSEYGKAWYNIGRCYDHLGDQEKSWDAHRMACMNADMDNEMGFYAYGIKSIKLKKFSEAAEAFAKVIQCNASYKHRFLYAYALLYSNQAENAVRVLKKLHTENPQDLSVKQLLQEAQEKINNIAFTQSNKKN